MSYIPLNVDFFGCSRFFNFLVFSIANNWIRCVQILFKQTGNLTEKNKDCGRQNWVTALPPTVNWKMKIKLSCTYLRKVQIFWVRSPQKVCPSSNYNSTLLSIVKWKVFKAILNFSAPTSKRSALCMVSIQEWFLIKGGLWWHAYGIYNLVLEDLPKKN